MKNIKTKKVILTQRDIDNSLTNETWDFGNKVLYDLCAKHPLHSDKKVIIAKTWLIGRSYAAALERFDKGPNGLNNESFYDKIIPKAFKHIDYHIDKLKAKLKESMTIEENLLESLEVHGFLVNELEKITRQNKRSFSSKYLHFHLPEIFFIYDSMANASLGKIEITVPKALKQSTKFDKIDSQYANFCCKCLALKLKVKEEFDIDLSNRQLDNLLLNMANNSKQVNF